MSGQEHVLVDGDTREALADEVGFGTANAGMVLRSGWLAAREAAAEKRGAEKAEAALGALRSRLAKVEAICATPDDIQWWEVVPYMDPPNQDEVVEVAVVAVDRVRAALEGEHSG